MQTHPRIKKEASSDLMSFSVHRKAKLQLLHILQEEGINDQWSRTMLEEYESDQQSTTF